MLEGRIVGVAALEVLATCLGPVGVATRVYVLPEFQRKGIGTALMSEIERMAKEHGAKEIHIWTDPKATWAVSFYKKLGYQEIEPAIHYGNEITDARIEKHGKGLLVLRKGLWSVFMTNRFCV